MAGYGLPWLIAPPPTRVEPGDESIPPGDCLSDPVTVAQAIARAATVIAGEAEPGAIARAIVEQVLQLGAHVAILFAADENRRELRLLAHARVPAALVASLERVSFETPMVTTRAALTRTIQTAGRPTDISSAHALARALLDDTGSRSVVATPLLVHGRLAGVLSWSLQHDHAFTAQELEALTSLGDVFALGLDNAWRAETERGYAVALNRSERKYRALYNHSVELIVVLDAAGRVLDANETALRATGVGIADVVGLGVPATPWWRMLQARQDDVVEAIDRAARGHSSRLDLTVTFPGGATQFLDLSVKPIEAAKGLVDMILIEARDVTAEREAAEERRRLVEQLDAQRRRVEAILEHAPCAVVLIETEPTERVFANPAGQRLLGIPLDFQRGREQYAGRICRPDGTPLPHDGLPSSRALRGETVLGEEILVHHADGTAVPLLEAAVPLRDESGRVVGAVLAGEDIRPLKEIERLREEWTSIVAHDLRQPVSVIGLHALALKKRDGCEREATAIAHAVRRLDRMIGDLLTASRIESRRLELCRRETDYGALLRGVAAQFTAGRIPRTIRLEVCDDLSRLWIDPDRIEQVLVNLVSNAVKYSYNDTPIDVVARRDGDRVVTSVTNEGQGIAPEEVPRLFARHHRTADSRTSGVPGLGLGLYIAGQLVQAHGGRIRVESVPGARTTFEFVLPLERRTAPASS